MYSKENQKKLNAILKKYNCTNKSPYSESYYDSDKVSWGYKPENSIRISDHWNFYSNCEVHCKTEDGVTKQGWWVGQYRNGVYTLIEQVLTAEEEKREDRCYKSYLVKEEKERARIGREEKRLARLQKEGHNFKIEYTLSEKHGRRFTYRNIAETCFVQGCWAYTNNGRKRVFEIVEAC